jgi:hypothetical protein
MRFGWKPVGLVRSRNRERPICSCRGLMPEARPPDPLGQARQAREALVKESIKGRCKSASPANLTWPIPWPPKWYTFRPRSTDGLETSDEVLVRQFRLLSQAAQRRGVQPAGRHLSKGQRQMPIAATASHRPLYPLHLILFHLIYPSYFAGVLAARMKSRYVRTRITDRRAADRRPAACRKNSSATEKRETELVPQSTDRRACAPRDPAQLLRNRGNQ